MIDRIAVIGAGFMGGGIGAEFALRLEHDVRVTLWDARPGGAATAVARAREVADALVEAGILLPEVATRRLARLATADTLAEVTDGASYVVEAVPEDLPTKQEVFRDLDRITGPDVILASNTSGFDPADLAKDLSHPARVVVAHYFGPAFLIPLVEVVPHPGTDPWVTERTAKLLSDAGKRPAQPCLGRCTAWDARRRLITIRHNARMQTTIGGGFGDTGDDPATRHPLVPWPPNDPDALAARDVGGPRSDAPS